MRAHFWERVDDREEVDAHGFDWRGGRVRKCEQCRTYQQRMRGVGYIWRPLAGRCQQED